MTEYDVDFGEKLAETARIVLNIGADTQEAVRVVTYLSLLSAEISLKAMLERAGIDPAVIRKRSHSLEALLEDFSGCQIEIEIAPGVKGLNSATRLRSIGIPYRGSNTTVGRVLQAEQEGASTYPNEVRYGEAFRHFPPAVLVGMADSVAAFAKEYWASLRVKNDS
jgi:hypothetical protein